MSISSFTIDSLSLFLTIAVSFSLLVIVAALMTVTCILGLLIFLAVTPKQIFNSTQKQIREVANAKL